MFELTKLLPNLFYPLGLTVLFGLLGFLATLFKRRRAGYLFLFLSLLVLTASSLPAASHWLVRSLEKRYPPQVDFPKVSAILLLGGGEVPPEAPRLYPEVSEMGDRIIHAARLFHKGVAPIIIAAGGPYVMSSYEGTGAEVAASILSASLNVPRSAIVLEDRSRNTFEHAPNVRAILESRKLPLDVVVVTSAMHMHRAVLVFQRYGFTVHPAPTDFMAEDVLESRATSFIPSVAALQNTTQALHEYYGLIAYSILDRI